MTLPQEIIRLKRDGLRLSEAEIAEFVAGLTTGVVSEGQAAAFAMAVFFRGMDLDERIALTRAMTLSGETIDWRAPDLPGPVLDKHSTGGVGDNVSLMLAPMLAACGAFVPMISGRGLGTPAVRSTSSIRSPATSPSPTSSRSSASSAKRAAPSSARPIRSPRPISASTPSATPRPSSRSR